MRVWGEVNKKKVIFIFKKVCILVGDSYIFKLCIGFRRGNLVV